MSPLLVIIQYLWEKNGYWHGFRLWTDQRQNQYMQALISGLRSSRFMKLLTRAKKKEFWEKLWGNLWWRAQWQNPCDVPLDKETPMGSKSTYVKELRFVNQSAVPALLGYRWRTCATETGWFDYDRSHFHWVHLEFGLRQEIFTGTRHSFPRNLNFYGSRPRCGLRWWSRNLC